MTCCEPTIGIIAVQGSFVEHASALKQLGVAAREVRLPEDLDGIDGIIFPGGESTTFLRLIDEFKLRQPLCNAISNGLPTLGTCAGAVVLAKRVSSHQMSPLGLLDISVTRNGFGRQVESFEENLIVEGITEATFRGVFIRAPIIESCGVDVRVLSRLTNKMIVACRQDRILATSFHPEFVPDLRIHQYFLTMLPVHGYRTSGIGA